MLPRGRKKGNEGMGKYLQIRFVILAAFALYLLMMVFFVFSTWNRGADPLNRSGGGLRPNTAGGVFSFGTGGTTDGESLEMNEVYKKNREEIENWISQQELFLQNMKDAESRIEKNLVLMENVRVKAIPDILSVQPLKVRKLKCVSWRATVDCDPYGSREPLGDQDCDTPIKAGTSGFCEVMDVNTKEKFRVMQSKCNALTKDVQFKCSEAPDFANFAAESEVAMQKAKEPGYALPNLKDNEIATKSVEKGILMVIYPKLLASTYATVKLIRSYGCTLPIEIWFRPEEMDATDSISKALKREFAPLTFNKILDPNAGGFNAKVYALYYSHFRQLLFLDADNAPVRDPSYLFYTKQFIDTGAVFWPDFWNPRNTIFNTHGDSLLWQALNMPFVDMFEQESAQLVLDRQRHPQAFDVLFYYAFHRPNLLETLRLAYGDKDLFRFAWIKTNSTYHMIETPAALAGDFKEGQGFCGMTMVQYDPNGDVMFMHRNGAKLGSDGNIKWWNQIQRLKSSSPIDKYRIKWAPPVDPTSTYCCKAYESEESFFEIVPIERFTFASLEGKLFEYAESTPGLPG